MPHINELYDFTVSMFVIHPTEPKMCLHWHVKLQLWNNFGGHIELNQDPLEALQQEMHEETGLNPDEYDIVKTYDGPENVGVKELPNPFGMHLWKYADKEHFHIDLPYIIKPKHTTFKPKAGESTNIEWFTIEKIRHYASQNKIDEGVLNISEWIFDRFM